MKITILSFYDRISSFHTLKPFLFSKHKKLFQYTNNINYCLKKDKNKILFMVRWFLKPDKVDMNLLKKLRNKYEQIFFFNGNAGGGIPRLEVLPYVDYFFNKALFKDFDLYKKKLYGDELFTNYYHEKNKISDPDHIDRKIVTNEKELSKLKLYWNIGIGDFPRHKHRQRAGVLSARTIGMKSIKPFYYYKKSKQKNSELYDIHARWGGPKRPTLLIHREQIIEKIKSDPRFLTGKVKQKQYNHEIKNSKITLSPFGWGELCFRDFEAIKNKSLLIKPDMSHLKTWPNIFIPNETYIPITWEADDLLEKVDFYLNNSEKRHQIINNAYNIYYTESEKIEEKLEEILKLTKL